MSPTRPQGNDGVQGTSQHTTNDEDPRRREEFTEEGARPGNLRAYLLPPSSDSPHHNSYGETSPGPSHHPPIHRSTTPNSPPFEFSSVQPLAPPSSGSEEDPTTDDHIPRPPNAFILFRSHMIRTGAIPKTVEGKNKDLSKIIGAVWQGLSPEERGQWEREAREAQRKHRLKYPNWRFAPGIQQGEFPKVKRAPKRKRKSDDGREASPIRKQRRRTSPVADESKGKATEGRDEASCAEDASHEVIYAPSSPLPYSFSIPLRSPPGTRPSFPLSQTTKKGKEKDPSSPVPPASSLRQPVPRRAPMPMQTVDRAVGPSPSQASTSHSLHVVSSTSPSPSASRHDLSLAPEDSAPGFSSDCQWTGHELDGESPRPYESVLHGTLSQSPSRSPGFESYSPRPEAPPLTSPGHSQDSFHSVSSFTESLPSPFLRPYHYDLSHASNPVAQDSEHSGNIVPLTHRYRRGSIDHTRSPLSQSLSFEDFPAHGDPPSTAPLGWQSFDLMMGNAPWPQQSRPPVGSSSATQLAAAYGSAVIGGTPLYQPQTSSHVYSATHGMPHIGASGTTQVASSASPSQHFYLPHFNRSSSSELSRALHYDHDPPSSASSSRHEPQHQNP